MAETGRSRRKLPEDEREGRRSSSRRVSPSPPAARRSPERGTSQSRRGDSPGRLVRWRQWKQEERIHEGSRERTLRVAERRVEDEEGEGQNSAVTASNSEGVDSDGLSQERLAVERGRGRGRGEREWSRGRGNARERVGEREATGGRSLSAKRERHKGDRYAPSRTGDGSLCVCGAGERSASPSGLRSFGDSYGTRPAPRTASPCVPPVYDHETGLPWPWSVATGVGPPYSPPYRSRASPPHRTGDLRRRLFRSSLWSHADGDRTFERDEERWGGVVGGYPEISASASLSPSRFFHSRREAERVTGDWRSSPSPSRLYRRPSPSPVSRDLDRHGGGASPLQGREGFGFRLPEAGIFSKRQLEGVSRDVDEQERQELSILEDFLKGRGRRRAEERGNGEGAQSASAQKRSSLVAEQEKTQRRSRVGVGRVDEEGEVTERHSQKASRPNSPAGGPRAPPSFNQRNSLPAFSEGNTQEQQHDSRDRSKSAFPGQSPSLPPSAVTVAPLKGTVAGSSPSSSPFRVRRGLTEEDRTGQAPPAGLLSPIRSLSRSSSFKGVSLEDQGTSPSAKGKVDSRRNQHKDKDVQRTPPARSLSRSSSFKGGSPEDPRDASPSKNQGRQRNAKPQPQSPARSLSRSSSFKGGSPEDASPSKDRVAPPMSPSPPPARTLSRSSSFKGGSPEDPRDLSPSKQQQHFQNNTQKGQVQNSQQPFEACAEPRPSVGFSSDARGKVRPPSPTTTPAAAAATFPSQLGGSPTAPEEPLAEAHLPSKENAKADRSPTTKGEGVSSPPRSPSRGLKAEDPRPSSPSRSPSKAASFWQNKDDSGGIREEAETATSKAPSTSKPKSPSQKPASILSSPKRGASSEGGPRLKKTLSFDLGEGRVESPPSPARRIGKAEDETPSAAASASSPKRTGERYLSGEGQASKRDEKGHSPHMDASPHQQQPEATPLSLQDAFRGTPPTLPGVSQRSNPSVSGGSPHKQAEGVKQKMREGPDQAVHEKREGEAQRGPTPLLASSGRSGEDAASDASPSPSRSLRASSPGARREDVAPRSPSRKSTNMIEGQSSSSQLREGPFPPGERQRVIPMWSNASAPFSVVSSEAPRDALTGAPLAAGPVPWVGGGVEVRRPATPVSALMQGATEATDVTLKKEGVHADADRLQTSAQTRGIPFVGTNSDRVIRGRLPVSLPSAGISAVPPLRPPFPLGSFHHVPQHRAPPHSQASAASELGASALTDKADSVKGRSAGVLKVEGGEERNPLSTSQLRGVTLPVPSSLPPASAMSSQASFPPPYSPESQTADKRSPPDSPENDKGHTTHLSSQKQGGGRTPASAPPQAEESLVREPHGEISPAEIPFVPAVSTPLQTQHNNVEAPSTRVSASMRRDKNVPPQVVTHQISTPTGDRNIVRVAFEVEASVPTAQGFPAPSPEPTPSASQAKNEEGRPSLSEIPSKEKPTDDESGREKERGMSEVGVKGSATENGTDHVVEEGKEESTAHIEPGRAEGEEDKAKASSVVHRQDQSGQEPLPPTVDQLRKPAADRNVSETGRNWPVLTNSDMVGATAPDAVQPSENGTTLQGGKRGGEEGGVIERERGGSFAAVDVSVRVSPRSLVGGTGQQPQQGWGSVDAVAQRGVTKGADEMAALVSPELPLGDGQPHHMEAVRPQQGRGAPPSSSMQVHGVCPRPSGADGGYPLSVSCSSTAVRDGRFDPLGDTMRSHPGEGEGRGGGGCVGEVDEMVPPSRLHPRERYLEREELGRVEGERKGMMKQKVDRSDPWYASSHPEGTPFGRSYRETLQLHNSVPTAAPSSVHALESMHRSPHRPRAPSLGKSRIDKGGLEQKEGGNQQTPEWPQQGEGGASRSISPSEMQSGRPLSRQFLRAYAETDSRMCNEIAHRLRRHSKEEFHHPSPRPVVPFHPSSRQGSSQMRARGASPDSPRAQSSHPSPAPIPSAMLASAASSQRPSFGSAEGAGVFDERERPAVRQRGASRDDVGEGGSSRGPRPQQVISFTQEEISALPPSAPPSTLQAAPTPSSFNFQSTYQPPPSTFQAAPTYPSHPPHRRSGRSVPPPNRVSDVDQAEAPQETSRPPFFPPQEGHQGFPVPPHGRRPHNDPPHWHSRGSRVPPDVWGGEGQGPYGGGRRHHRGAPPPSRSAPPRAAYMHGTHQPPHPFPPQSGSAKRHAEAPVSHPRSRAAPAEVPAHAMPSRQAPVEQYRPRPLFPFACAYEVRPRMPVSGECATLDQAPVAGWGETVGREAAGTLSAAGAGPSPSPFTHQPPNYPEERDFRPFFGNGTAREGGRKGETGRGPPTRGDLLPAGAGHQAEDGRWRETKPIANPPSVAVERAYAQGTAETDEGPQEGPPEVSVSIRVSESRHGGGGIKDREVGGQGRGGTPVTRREVESEDVGVRGNGEFEREDFVEHQAVPLMTRESESSERGDGEENQISQNVPPVSVRGDGMSGPMTVRGDRLTYPLFSRAVAEGREIVLIPDLEPSPERDLMPQKAARPPRNQHREKAGGSQRTPRTVASPPSDLVPVPFRDAAPVPSQPRWPSFLGDPTQPHAFSHGGGGGPRPTEPGRVPQEKASTRGGGGGSIKRKEGVARAPQTTDTARRGRSPPAAPHLQRDKVAPQKHDGTREGDRHQQQQPAGLPGWGFRVQSGEGVSAHRRFHLPPPKAVAEQAVEGRSANVLPMQSRPVPSSFETHESQPPLSPTPREVPPPRLQQPPPPAALSMRNTQPAQRGPESAPFARRSLAEPLSPSSQMHMQTRRTSLGSLPSFSMGPSASVRDPSARPSDQMPPAVQEAVERTLHVGGLQSRGSVPVVKKPEEGKTDAHVNSLDGLAAVEGGALAAHMGRHEGYQQNPQQQQGKEPSPEDGRQLPQGQPLPRIQTAVQVPEHAVVQDPRAACAAALLAAATGPPPNYVAPPVYMDTGLLNAGLQHENQSSSKPARERDHQSAKAHLAEAAAGVSHAPPTTGEDAGALQSPPPLRRRSPTRQKKAPSWGQWNWGGGYGWGAPRRSDRRHSNEREMNWPVGEGILHRDSSLAEPQHSSPPPARPPYFGQYADHEAASPSRGSAVSPKKAVQRVNGGGRGHAQMVPEGGHRRSLPFESERGRDSPEELQRVPVWPPAHTGPQRKGREREAGIGPDHQCREGRSQSLHARRTTDVEEFVGAPRERDAFDGRREESVPPAYPVSPSLAGEIDPAEAEALSRDVSPTAAAAVEGFRERRPYPPCPQQRWPWSPSKAIMDPASAVPVRKGFQGYAGGEEAKQRHETLEQRRARSFARAKAENARRRPMSRPARPYDWAARGYRRDWFWAQGPIVGTMHSPGRRGLGMAMDY